MLLFNEVCGSVGMRRPESILSIYSRGVAPDEFFRSMGLKKECYRQSRSQVRQPGR